MIDLAEIRTLAVNATMMTFRENYENAMREFRRAVSPRTVIALLDRIADLESDRASLRRTVERFTEAARNAPRSNAADLEAMTRSRDHWYQTAKVLQQDARIQTATLEAALALLTPEQRAEIRKPAPHDIAVNNDGTVTADPSILRRRQREES